MSKKIVIALGGNALEDSAFPTAENQLKVVRASMAHVAELIASGARVVITHGNGPQVGRIALQNEAAKGETPPMPFDICGAMSQGMIGYHIQQALKGELDERGVHAEVASVVTQVVVDPDDKAFANPTKPIGPFYTQDEAEVLAKEKGYFIKEDAGRGFRRMIASPKPVEIVELASIEALIEAGSTVVTVGGGGIPVAKGEDGSLAGVEAVIDKDFASSKLAENLDADLLVILTEVEQVALNFGKPDEKWLDHITADEAKQYIDQGHFAPGSMLPKVEACLSFVQSKKGRKAVITSLANVNNALAGKGGTHILG